MILPKHLPYGSAASIDFEFNGWRVLFRIEIWANLELLSANSLAIVIGLVAVLTVAFVLIRSKMATNRKKVTQ